jgi:hypothetical protein
MIPNLYVDHLSTQYLSNSDELRAEIVTHPRTYDAAAREIGLTRSEYNELKEDLLMDRHVTYGLIERHLNAMAGRRGSYVYAVHNAYVEGPTVYGWRIPLKDGKVVYVPQECGNLSVGYRKAVVAVVPPTHHYYHHTKQVTVAVLPPTPIVIAPPSAAPVAVEAPPASAPVSSAASGGARYPIYDFFPAVVPFLLGNTGHITEVPPCSEGSNSQFACRK